MHRILSNTGPSTAEEMAIGSSSGSYDLQPVPGGSRKAASGALAAKQQQQEELDRDLDDLLGDWDDEEDEKSKRKKQKPKFRAKSLQQKTSNLSAEVSVEEPHAKENSLKTPQEEHIERPKSRKGPPEQHPETITPDLLTASGSREVYGTDKLTVDGSGRREREEKVSAGLLQSGGGRSGNTKGGGGGGKDKKLNEFDVEDEYDLLSGMGLNDGRTSSAKPFGTQNSAVSETSAKSSVQTKNEEVKNTSEERNASTKVNKKAEDEDGYVFGGYAPSISSGHRRKGLPTNISTGGISVVPALSSGRGRNSQTIEKLSQSAELQVSQASREARKPTEAVHKGRENDSGTQQKDFGEVTDKSLSEIAGKPAKKSVRFAAGSGSDLGVVPTSQPQPDEELGKGERREEGGVTLGQETTTEGEEFIKTSKTVGGEKDTQLVRSREAKLEHPVFPWQQRKQRRRGFGDSSINTASLTSTTPPPTPDTQPQSPTAERGRGSTSEGPSQDTGYGIRGGEVKSGATDRQKTHQEPGLHGEYYQTESLKAKLRSLETQLEESEAERRSLADRFKTAEEEKREILGPQRSKEMELSSQLDTLRAKVHQLECERDQLKISVENMKTHSTEEQAGMDKSHSARIQALEESFQRREAKWREELETETAHHRKKLEEAERDNTDSLLALRRKMEALELSKTNEIAQLQGIHRSAVADMKKEHEMDLNRMKDVHRREIEALKAAHSHTQRLSELSSQVEETVRAVSALQTRVDQRHRQNTEECHQSSLSHQENLKTLEERLGRQYRDVESSRELLASLVGRLEAHLSQGTQTLEGERWSLQQESARVKAAERALEEQRSSLLARLEEERRELTDSKERFLGEQQKLLSECLSECHSLAAERAQLEMERKTFAEMEKREAQRRQEMGAECEAMLATVSEEKARLSTEATRLQGQESRLRAESAHLEQERQAVERERTTLLEKMNLTQTSGQEANKLNQSALALRREGEEKMEAALRLQAQLTQQAEWVNRERQQLEERESQLVSERLAFARECREHQESQQQQRSQSESAHSHPSPILTSTRRMGFPAGLDLPHSLPQPQRPSSRQDYQKLREAEENVSQPHQQSSHQEERSSREEQEFLDAIQHRNSLMLINHYNRPYLQRNKTPTL